MTISSGPCLLVLSDFEVYGCCGWARLTLTLLFGLVERTVLWKKRGNLSLYDTHTFQNSSMPPIPNTDQIYPLLLWSTENIRGAMIVIDMSSTHLTNEELLEL